MSSKEKTRKGRPPIFKGETMRTPVIFELQTFVALQETAQEYYGGSISAAVNAIVATSQFDNAKDWAAKVNHGNMVLEGMVHKLQGRVENLEKNEAAIKADLANLKRSVQSTLQHLSPDERPHFQSLVRRLQGKSSRAGRKARRST